MRFTSIDLFSGCGGLSEGMRQAGFTTSVALEKDELAVETYKLNHPETQVIPKDIRKISVAKVERMLDGTTVHLLAGCPPCQGFSSMRRLNKSEPVQDDRNDLILEYIRFVKALKPLTIMMENVPGLVDYDLFQNSIQTLKTEGYKWIDYDVVNIKDYGVPQSRRRLVLVGSRLGEIKIAKGSAEKKTVRDILENLPLPDECDDPIHKIFPSHTPKVQKRIELTPINGGSRKDLPEEYTLKCHKDKNIGFNDVYGRLRWDDVSTTITGGCLNPSKGRFLHPEQNRCISAREAALLQSFPPDYKFISDISIGSIALLIGNALPPKFSYIQSLNIYEHLQLHLAIKSSKENCK